MPRAISPAELDSDPETDTRQTRLADEGRAGARHEQLPAANRIAAARFRLADSHHQKQAEIKRNQALSPALPGDEQARLKTTIENHDRTSQICQWLEGHYQDENPPANNGQNQAGRQWQLELYANPGSLVDLWRNHDDDHQDSIAAVYNPGSLEAVCNAYWQFEEANINRPSLIEQKLVELAGTGGMSAGNEAKQRSQVEADYEKLIRSKRQAFATKLDQLQKGHDEVDRRLEQKVSSSRQTLEFLARPEIETDFDDVIGHFANLLEIQACGQNRDGDNNRAKQLRRLAQSTRRATELFAGPDSDSEADGRQLIDNLWQYQVETHRQLIPEEDQRAVAEILDTKANNTDRIEGFASYWILLLKAQMQPYLEEIDSSRWGISLPGDKFDQYEPKARQLRARINQVEDLQADIRRPGDNNGDNNREQLARFAIALLRDFPRDIHACIGSWENIEPHECSECSADLDAQGNTAYRLPHPTKPDTELLLA